MNVSKQRLLVNLPEEIYYSFRDYLTQDDYQQLLNTSKKLFLEIRMKSIIYHLTEKYSIKYCEDENYRNQLIEKVENPFKQIRIKLDYLRINCYEYLLDLHPVHLICTNFEGADNNISLRHVKEFTLYCYDFEITTLLNVNQCETANFAYCQGITDTSSLKDCEHVTLDGCENISDFSSLGKQKTLLIKQNARLNNVMNFGSIRTLILRDCYNLKDVSPLHGVSDLSLIGCRAVSDISSLGGHHRLEISHGSPILTGYDALKDIPIVKLCACDISDVSVLSHAKVVYLEECYILVDVSPLRDVRELILTCCWQIEDISKLSTVQKLTIDKLPKLKNYEGINQITDLSLLVSDLNDGVLDKFPNMKRIKISFLSFDYILPLLPTFTNLHSLTLCHVSVKIEACVDIHTVIIESCTLENISGLGKNRVVRLFQSQGDDLDVSSLATVPLVSIIKCQFMKVNYESLKNVPRLKICD